MNEHGSAVEGDLRVHAHVDMKDMWTGKLTLRQIVCYIEALPRDTRTQRRWTGMSPIYDQWSQTDLLLGSLIDSQRMYHFHWLQSKSEKKLADAPESVLPGEHSNSKTAATMVSSVETESGVRKRRDDLPVVSLREAMGLVNDPTKVYEPK